MSWPTGAKNTVSLAGALLPMMSSGEPYLLQVIGADSVHLPLFTSKAAFDRAIAEGLVKCDRLVRIDEPAEVIAAIPDGVFIAFDAHRTERGTVVYQLLDPRHIEFASD